MHYLVGTSDFHSAVLDEIAGALSGRVWRVNHPKNGSIWGKARESPRSTVIWLLCVLDPHSHAVISHPFSVVFSLFGFAARCASFYDDGVAYYYDAPVPTSRPTRAYRRLARRFVDWGELGSHPTYRDVLRTARIRNMYAIYPHLLPSAKAQIVPVSMPVTSRSFTDKEGIHLFLDTRADTIEGVDPERVVHILRMAASRAPDGMMFFKPHPSQLSPVSRRLRSEPWAVEWRGNTEHAFAGTLRVATLYSFYSSASMTLRALQPDAEIIVFRPSTSTFAKPPESLFREISAKVLKIE